MRRMGVAIALLISCFSGKAARAGTIDGYVYLDRNITTQFASDGRAEYFNDLSQPGPAALSGTHSVNGPPNFQTPVTGSGLYLFTFRGPAESGQCFTTRLVVSANPSGAGNTVDQTLDGPESVCVVVTPGPGPGGGGPIACSGNTIDPSDCNSPILIDMGRGGYDLSGADDGVSFDINADGILDRITWTGRESDVALLAMDRNGNGTIDDGSELFGDHTLLSNGSTAANGFEALTSFDTNRDSIIDTRDEIWPRLLLWTDRNHDAIAANDELALVADSNVNALRLDYKWSGRRDSNGNIFRWRATLVRRTHGVAQYYDVYLRRAV